MPLYDFICEECEFEFEALINYSDDNPICEKCGGATARHITRIAMPIVKGSEHRPLDCIVGADSEKKWDFINKRKENRKVKKRG